MWEICVCTVKTEQATSIAYPYLGACRHSHCLRDPLNGWRPTGWLVSLSNLVYLCPLAQALCPSQWGTILVLCVDLASLSFSGFPVLVLSSGQDQAFLMAWFRWLLYNGVSSSTLEALVSCSIQVRWHLEHTVWSCSATRLRGPLATCLLCSSIQEAFSKWWPLMMMRQCWRERSLVILEVILTLSALLWWGWWYWLLLEKFLIQENYRGKVTALFCLSLIFRIPPHHVLYCFRNFSGLP